MSPPYTIYLNGNYFDSLSSALAVGDRPEPYRRHEKALWTIYQLLKLGEHEVAILDEASQLVLQTKEARELKAWVEGVYPGFGSQLDALVYTRFPHPADQL